MSLAQTDAERIPHDLSSFAFSSGVIGGLKTIGWHPVLPGDGFETDLVGSLRLAPLRRGLAVDCKTEIFSFYVPYRMIYGFDLWNEFLRAADGATAPPPTLPSFPGNFAVGDEYEDAASFLATLTAQDGSVPLWLYKAYEKVFDNFFRHPQAAPTFFSSLEAIPFELRRDGFQCAHLPCIWSGTSVLGADGSYDNVMDVTGGLNIANLNAAFGQQHIEQERDFFAQRYRDLMDGFGGHANPDAESRPTLLMHSEFWSSGYDVNGTDQTSLGSFSGRVTQSFRHQVPRFFVPEHGVIIHLAVNRFPPTHVAERHYLATATSPTYFELAGDPAIVGNNPQVTVPMDTFCRDGEGDVLIPAGQWYRTHPSYVDFRYLNNEGFPFLYQPLKSGAQGIEQSYIDSTEYDQCFQTTQLGHWNMQAKFNTTVLRRLPTARESILTVI